MPESFGFESKSGYPGVYTRITGDYDAVVHRGPGLGWAFTIWKGSVCVAGICNREWSAGTASDIANKLLAAFVDGDMDHLDDV